MAIELVRHNWILEWLQSNHVADSTNADFHDAYHARFPEYKRRETYWGAAPVAQANRDLSTLWRRGQVNRRNVGIANWQPGFPKWTPSYSLS